MKPTHLTVIIKSTLLAIIILVFVPTAHSDTITVCAIGCDFMTIQIALENTNTQDNDTIVVMDSPHTEQGIQINKSVTITGQNGIDTIIQANPTQTLATDRVFKISGNSAVILLQLTIRHGTGNNSEFGGTNTGGGIFVESGASLTIENSTITSNDSDFGGGIYNNGGVIEIYQSTISNNRSNGFDHRGGGIRNNGGVIHISESTISGNSAYIGGGISNQSGDINISNSTISGNIASSRGGGIYTQLVSSDINISNSTITMNSATSSGGGLYVVNSAVVRFSHTIISGNNSSSGPNIRNFATVTVGNYNIIGENGSCGDVCGGGSDINPTEPIDQILDTILSDNGGSTLTHALVPTSPAIDAGNPTSCQVLHQSSAPPPYDSDAIITIDQRGSVRADGNNRGGTVCDIGAIEANSNETPTVVTLKSISVPTLPNTLFTITIIISIVVGISGSIWASRKRNKEIKLADSP